MPSTIAGYVDIAEMLTRAGACTASRNAHNIITVRVLHDEKGQVCLLMNERRLKFAFLHDLESLF